MMNVIVGVSIFPLYLNHKRGNLSAKKHIGQEGVYVRLRRGFRYKQVYVKRERKQLDYFAPINPLYTDTSRMALSLRPLFQYAKPRLL